MKVYVVMIYELLDEYPANDFAMSCATFSDTQNAQAYMKDRIERYDDCKIKIGKYDAMAYDEETNELICNIAIIETNIDEFAGD